MSYNKLYFNSIEVVTDKDGNVSVTPNFLCPKCGDQTKPETRPKTKIPASKALTKADKSIDKNTSERFIMPCCGSEINLFVATYKAKDMKDPQICVSTLPIDTVWFETEKSS